MEAKMRDLFWTMVGGGEVVRRGCERWVSCVGWDVDGRLKSVYVGAKE